MQKIRLDRYASPRKVVSSVPSSMERILARCMEKLPSSRYPSTQTLIDDLMEFLASRVGMNHSARLVMYMRDVGVIGDHEAEEILTAGATRTMASAGDRQLVRSSGLVFSAMFLSLLAMGGAIQASDGRFSGGDAKFKVHHDAPIVPDKAGYIRVVVNPWAHVYVDGQHVATTPTAQPIALPPGKHYIKYKNPYFLEQTAQIQVKPGETTVLQTTLEPRRAPGDKPSGETAKR
jgi:hypothetical protein